MKAALVNLELSRELYTDDQRKQFFAEFQAAIDARLAAFKAIKAHRRNKPDKWKIWKRSPAEWRQASAKLKQAYSQECWTLIHLKNSHPLLVKIFSYKTEPLN
ncbi:MAG: hypothetical protein RSG77_20855 [Hafnia sp.]